MYLFGCIPLFFHSIKTVFVQPLFSNDKKRPASSSYGMLTGSVILGLVQTPILSDNSLRFYQNLCIQ